MAWTSKGSTSKSKDKKDIEICKGGRSYNCKHEEHEKATEVWCYRCDSVIGCRNCCESPHELICLNCHNWATKKGLKHHGDIIPNFKVPHVRTDNGWKHYEPSIGSKVDEVIRNADKMKIEDIFGGK
jgi:hypothetical protein